MFAVAPASATRIVNADELAGAKQYHAWIADARGEVPLPKRIEVIEWSRPGGIAWPWRFDPPRIAVPYYAYLWECRPRGGYCEANDPRYDRDRLGEQALFIHEVAHIWDLERGAKRNQRLGYRDRFARIRGMPLPHGRWLSQDRYVERWADEVTRCVTGMTVYRWRTTERRSRRICRLVRGLA